MVILSPKEEVNIKCFISSYTRIDLQNTLHQNTLHQNIHFGILWQKEKAAGLNDQNAYRKKPC